MNNDTYRFKRNYFENKYHSRVLVTNSWPNSNLLHKFCVWSCHPLHKWFVVIVLYWTWIEVKRRPLFIEMCVWSEFIASGSWLNPDELLSYSNYRCSLISAAFSSFWIFQHSVRVFEKKVFSKVLSCGIPVHEITFVSNTWWSHRYVLINEFIFTDEWCYLSWRRSINERGHQLITTVMGVFGPVLSGLINNSSW